MNEQIVEKALSFDAEQVIFYIEEGMQEIASQPDFDGDYFRDGCEALFQSIVVGQAMAVNKGGLPIDKDGVSSFITDEANNLIWCFAFFRHQGMIAVPTNWPYSIDEMRRDYAMQFGDLHQLKKYEFPWVRAKIMTSEIFKK